MNFVEIQTIDKETPLVNHSKIQTKIEYLKRIIDIRVVNELKTCIGTSN